MDEIEINVFGDCDFQFTFRPLQILIECFILI